MPLKVNVSVSKKVGQPDFGSLGASCAVEVELPNNIVFDDLEAFHRHARSVYIAATQAVNDEFARDTERPHSSWLHLTSRPINSMKGSMCPARGPGTRPEARRPQSSR